jgi:hypothetical protein
VVSGVGSRGYVFIKILKETTKEEQTVGLGNLGDLGNLDVGQLTQYIPNVNFPASKDEVLSDAQNNDAPQEVLDGIRNSGKDTFNSADEVLQAAQGRL